MAGIGFELKKIFRGGGVIATLRGVVYAALTTIGPTIMVITVLLALYLFLGFSGLAIGDRELLSSTFLYAFIFSMIATAPVAIVMSRFIADKLFEERQEDILPSFYMGLAINLIGAALLGVPFAVRAYFIGGIDPLYMLTAYCMYTGLVIAFYEMTYITAIKEYKYVTYAYLAGMGTAFLLGLALHFLFGVRTVWAILLGFAVGFMLIALLLLAQIRSFFSTNSRNYRACLVYFRRHASLLFSNLFYTLGLYAHNFVFWTSDLRVVIARVFISAPAYDMATCLAMFTNISLTVIFVVRVETRFHLRYQRYIEAVIGGRKIDIDYAKREMFHTLTGETWFIVQMQLVITVMLFFVSTVLLPLLGFGGVVLQIYPVLAASYIVIFIMESMVVFLYYFEDTRGTIYATLTFLIVTVVASIFMMRLHQLSYYGLGAFAGAFAGWTVTYFRLRHIEKRLDYQVFCRGHIIGTTIDKAEGISHG
jgi:uncharacterized membrane protein